MWSLVNTAEQILQAGGLSQDVALHKPIYRMTLNCQHARDISTSKDKHLQTDKHI